MPNQCNIFIIAGESSGDIHGSYLMNSLSEVNPSVQFSGIGGELMKKQGLNSLVPLENMAVMGFVEVIKHLPFFMKVKNKVINTIQKTKFDHIILIDYPGFNLNLLPKIKAITNAKITYYICPQIWAWKEKRIDLLKKYVDNRIVIFPFEPEWYKKRNVDVFYPGHPILDEWQPTSKNELAEKLGLNPDFPILTLYPGSREQEFKKHFNLFLKSAKIIKEKIPKLQVILGCASGVKNSPLLKQTPDWLIIENKNPQLCLEVADVAIIASGTSTLEAAVYGTPGVVVYKLSAISWWLSKLFVNVKFAGMVNLIADEEIMPELLQEKATPKNISSEIIDILENPSKNKIIKDKLNSVLNKLGNAGVSDRIANYILGKL